MAEVPALPDVPSIRPEPALPQGERAPWQRREPRRRPRAEPPAAEVAPPPPDGEHRIDVRG